MEDMLANLCIYRLQESSWPEIPGCGHPEWCVVLGFKLNGDGGYVKEGLELAPMGSFDVGQGGCQLQT